MRSCVRSILSLSLLTLLVTPPATTQLKPKPSNGSAAAPTSASRVLEFTDHGVDQR